ncbi:MAG: ABC transporter permease [Treponema sp.]|jgi:ribose transport system permease protein|nr:ABC transporter permease [Treponema sp.]
MNTGIPFNSIKRICKEYSCFIILIGLIIVASILSPVFFSKQNIFNVFRQQAPIAMLALGVLIVIVTGGIDLSTGAMLAVSNTVVAYFITFLHFDSMMGVWLAIVMGILVGTAIGCVNGAIVAYLKMPSFIVTLAITTMGRGVAYMITMGSPIRLPVKPDINPGSERLFWFGQNGDPLIGMPFSAWVVILFVILFWFLMKYTTFGRLIVATGSNTDASRLAGINVKKYMFSAYMICGALSGVAGVLITARAGIATPSAGTGFELTAIAAAVIGGASLSGGKGRVGNTIVGVFILALIGNIMNLLSIPVYPQQIMQGAIIIIAVLLNAGKQK